MVRLLASFFASLVLASTASTPEHRLLTPDAFPVPHRGAFVLHEGTVVESLTHALATFRVRSHVEVVLVGERFTAAMVDDLSSSLRDLARLAAASSPLKYVHEEMVYHVTLGAALQQQLQDVVRKGGRYVNPTDFADVLVEHHVHLSMGATTIFVFHSGATGSYVYASKVPSCPQRSFLSKEGYALIDLSAKFMPIRSLVDATEHALSSEAFPFLDRAASKDTTGARQASLHDLATLVHRSAESLIPFPIFAGDAAGAGAADAQKNTWSGTDVVVVTLCLHPGACEADEESVESVRSLLRELTAGQRAHLGVVTYEVSVDSDAAVAHALHAATSYPTGRYMLARLEDLPPHLFQAPQPPFSSLPRTPSTGSHAGARLSSTELLYWLGSCTTVRNILLKHGHPDHPIHDHRHHEQGQEDPSAPPLGPRRVLPVFVLKVSDGVDVALDGGTQAVSGAFPVPPGGWLVDDTDRPFLPPAPSAHDTDSDQPAPVDAHWPATAVVAARTVSGVPLPGARSGLECGGSELEKTADDYKSDLLGEMLRALYGISPAHHHYSSSSRRVVADYTWAPPPAMRTLMMAGGHHDAGDGYSFREHRMVARHAIVHDTEAVLASFAGVLADLGAMRPAANVSAIVGLGHLLVPNIEVSAFSTAAALQSRAVGGKATSAGAAAVAAARQTFPTGSAVIAGEYGLLAAFLFHVDAAADAFAQLNFPLAAEFLSHAEVRLEAARTFGGHARAFSVV